MNLTSARPLPTQLIGDPLERILQRLAIVRATSRSVTDPILRQQFDALKHALECTDAFASHPTIRMRWSLGRSLLAHVPAMAIMDVRETTTARRGLHCSLLFREDSSGVYLTMIQGVAELFARLKRSIGQDELARTTARLRECFAELAAHGFALDDTVDLRTRSAFGEDCRHAVVAHRLYEAARVADDRAVEEDLAVLLDAYVGYVDAKVDRPVPETWLLCADRGRALECDALHPVLAYGEFIRAGHDVLLFVPDGQPYSLCAGTVLSIEDPVTAGGVRIRVGQWFDGNAVDDVEPVRSLGKTIGSVLPLSVAEARAIVHAAKREETT